MSNLTHSSMRIFLAVYDLRSVSRAAKALHMSQSGVSTALGNLREMLGDPLFIGTASGMQPSNRARELAQPIREAVACIEQRILRKREFDPQVDQREFRIALTDISEAIYMPRALTAVMLTAPRVSLRSVLLPPAELEKALSEGHVDLAVGYFPDLIATEFLRRKIGQHSFVCIASSANRQVIEDFNLEKYTRARHVVVESPVRSQGLLDRFMRERGIERQVALTTPNSMSLPEIVANTNLLASMPRALADYFSSHKRIVQLDLPFRSPVYDAHLHWSKTVNNDPANRWLRNTLFNAFSNKR